MEGLDEGPGCAAVECTNGHGGEDNTSRNLEAKGGGCEERSEERGKEEEEDWGSRVCGVTKVVRILAVRGAFGEERGDK